MDIGYQADGTYLVILIGKVKTVSESLDSKELRYAKSLFERGQKTEAKHIINDIVKANKDDKAVAEAMYCKVLWKFSSNTLDTYEKLKTYYPKSKYVGKLKSLLDERERESKRIAAERERESKKLVGNITSSDGRFYAGAKGVVLDTKTNLMWSKRNTDVELNWYDAIKYCEDYCGGGYIDWRMPTMDELESLYKHTNFVLKWRKVNG